MIGGRKEERKKEKREVGEMAFKLLQSKKRKKTRRGNKERKEGCSFMPFHFLVDLKPGQES